MYIGLMEWAISRISNNSFDVFDINEDGNSSSS